MKKRVLVVEDEKNIRDFIKLSLEIHEYVVTDFDNAEDALNAFYNKEFDIALLDVMLPGMSGIELCKKLRSSDNAVGIIMLTAKSQEMDKIKGLSVGADDYITKPFSTKEVIARIDALCRKVELLKKTVRKETMLSNGNLSIDIEKELLYSNSEEVDLTMTEYKIMKVLFLNAGKPISRDDIVDEVWGEDYVGSPKVVDVNIQRIRKKINDNGDYIKTVWGIGYRLVVQS